MNRFTNKGTADDTVPGAQPFRKETLDEQVERVIKQLRACATPLDRWVLLQNLSEVNERLHYATLLKHTVELLPIVYTPTVGEACQKYSELWRYPRGLFLNKHHRGQMKTILETYRDTNGSVDVCVVTDGSRILGLGDLGMNGHGICVGKLCLYTVTAGVAPSRVLPVSLDVGCNVQEIREHPQYLGIPEPRINGEEYNALVAEYVTAFQEVFPEAVLQFEDFSNEHAFDLLEAHRGHGKPVFNDDIQGTGCVAAAAAASAFRAMAEYGLEGDPRKQRYVFLGAGAGGVGVADALANLSVQAGSMVEEARAQFWLVDSRGLIHAGRADYKQGKMAAHKLGFANARGVCEDRATLLEVIREVKPTALVGLSTIGKAFNKEIIEALCETCERPLVFAMSNPTSKAECTSEECFEFSKGKAFYASGSPMPEIPACDGSGVMIRPSQANNSYVFGAIGYGAQIGRCTAITDTMIGTVANAVAAQTPKDYLRKGMLLPDLEDIREISARSAVAMIKEAWKEGVCELPHMSDEELLETVKAAQWVPEY